MARETYHHGNLRKDLLDLAVLELESGGSARLSLRELATRLGVARSAPYRHFASRDELLQAVARKTVEEIRAGFLRALKRDGAPRERLLDGVRWYLDFASRQPERYRLMFDTTAEWNIDIEKEAESDSSFGIFLTLVAGVAETDNDAQLHAIAIATWSLLHGYAMLRMQRTVNRQGFISRAEQAVLALAVNIDKIHS
jgi:AcrR family transcriptional regulator